MKPKIISYLYMGAGAVEVFAELTHHGTLRCISKPLLMPLLIAFYVRSAGWPQVRMHRLMVAAFVFSWIGDVALMFTALNENFFLLGLVGFLITHLLYARSFAMVRSRDGIPLLRRRAWVALPLLAYFAALIAVVLPAVPADMKIPVAVYSTVIAVMVLSALNRYRRVSESSFAMVFGGALQFMLSDSLIAVNKFLCSGTMFMAGVWIMILYITGQYLIAKGMLRNDEI